MLPLYIGIACESSTRWSLGGTFISANYKTYSFNVSVDIYTFFDSKFFLKICLAIESEEKNSLARTFDWEIIKLMSGKVK